MNFNKMWEKNHEDRLAYNEYNRLRQHRWNPRLNAISREANKLAGGYNIYKKKTRDERLQLRRTAEARLFYEEDNIRKETENEAFLRTIIPPKPSNIAPFSYPPEHKDRLERDGSTVELAIKARKENKKDGFPYVLEHPYYPGIRKLGYSYNPRSRLSTYNVGCPYKLFSMPYISVYLEDAALAEATVQETLKEYHVSGEWYEVSRELAIKTIEDYVESLNELRQKQKMD